MKRIISYVLIFAMLAGVGIPTGAIVQSKTKTLKLAKKSVTLKVKESVKVKYTSSKKPTVKSKNKKIATAKLKASKKRIVITGVKKGKTKIAVKAFKKTQYIKVTVKKAAKEAEPTPEPTVDPAKVAALKNMDSYSKSVNTFSFSTFDGLKKAKAGENSFSSPLSIYIAMSMLTNGADNNTKTQLLSALGISDLNDWNNKVQALLNGSSDNKVKLSISNALWLGNKFEKAAGIDKDFVEPIQNNYKGVVKKDVDLTSQGFVDDVNKWADESTNGMIKEVIKEPLKEEAALLIANAIYFLGDWKYQFKPTLTYDADFNGTNGKKQVKMMSQSNVYGTYFKDKNFVGAALPYGEGNYEMDILMSADTGTDAGKVWDALSMDEKMSTFAQFTLADNKKRIDSLRLPKFEMETGYSDEVIDILKALGAKDVFIPFTSDLSKIGKDLYVSKIIHKARLKVDEKGTEAAAVTTVQVDVASAVMPTEDRIEFHVERPFIFAIRDTISGMILFIGEVDNL